MNRKLVPVVIVLLVFAFVGGVGLLWWTLETCNVGAGASWEIEVGTYETRTAQNGSFYFRGAVALGGTGQPRLEDVRVVFLDTDGPIKHVSVGDFGVNAQSRRNVTTWVPAVPNRIGLEASSIETAEDTEWALVGLIRTSGGRYGEYVVREGPDLPDYCE